MSAFGTISRPAIVEEAATDAELAAALEDRPRLNADTETLPWQTAVQYVAGDLYSFNGSTWMVTVDHVSGVAPDAAKRTLVAQGSATAYVTETNLAAVINTDTTNTFKDIAAMSVDCVVGAGEVTLELDLYALTVTTVALLTFQLYDVTAGASVRQRLRTLPAGYYDGLILRKRWAAGVLPAGARTFKPRMATNAGVLSAVRGDGAANSSWLRVTCA